LFGDGHCTTLHATTIVLGGFGRMTDPLDARQVAGITHVGSVFIAALRVAPSADNRQQKAQMEIAAKLGACFHRSDPIRRRTCVRD
jgi:hypothetical protein